MIGTEEGDPCGRYNDEEDVTCDGEMVIIDPVDCRCHISPPCSACVDNSPVCSVRGKTGDEE